jgi:catechol 2,3-dioxygenase-like lactoylglutathione lyase family enzyme
MPKPQIRHIAMFASDPAKVAKFYEEVFEMEVVHRSPTGAAVFLSDGYITMAVLQHSANGQAMRGLNHFGFKVESNAEIGAKIDQMGLPGPLKRPADRPYAEQRAVDPEGNMFDISQHGFQKVETENDRAEQPAPEPAAAR